MNHLAIDVSKEELVIFASVTGKHYSIPNTKMGIKNFLDENKFCTNETVIGCESTGDYHLQVCKLALECGYQVKVINPILTKQIISATVRKKKTDYSDAEIIAKLLESGQGNSISLESLQQSKKTMLRIQKKIVDCTSDLKRIKKTLETKSKIMDVDECLETINRCIQFLENESGDLTKKACEGQKSHQEEIIDSVPGCGEKLSAIISTEAGDIKRFPSAKQFKAYVGIDPKVSQSGNSLYTGKITKRGNSNLRYALYLSANIARIHDPSLKDFYDKKRNEGKSHRHCVCAVARKLCERIYAIVTKDCIYQKNK